MGRQCVVMIESRICFYVIHCIHWLHERTTLHYILTLYRLGVTLQCHVSVTEALVVQATRASSPLVHEVLCAGDA
eukprot:COSAG06_NODE_7559_length_2459_cov_6.489831_2_plen_75_part_00